MGIISVKTGTSGVTLTFQNIDNSLSVEVNPDGPQGNGKLGWTRVLEVNSSGFGYYGGNYSISLDSLLSAYQAQGATSVSLAIVASNWVGPGSVTGSLSYPGGATNINLAPPVWTSQQQAYTLVF